MGRVRLRSRSPRVRKLGPRLRQRQLGVNARLARADGSTDSDDPTKGEAWVAVHPAEVAVSEALGYPEGEPLP